MKKAITGLLMACLIFTMAGVVGAVESDGLDVSFYRDKTEYNLGQNVILRAENISDGTITGTITPEYFNYNDEWSDFDYRPYPLYLEPGWMEEPIFWTGNGGELTQPGQYRFRVDLDNGSIFYTDEITLK